MVSLKPHYEIIDQEFWPLSFSPQSATFSFYMAVTPSMPSPSLPFLCPLSPLLGKPIRKSVHVMTRLAWFGSSTLGFRSAYIMRFLPSVGPSGV